MMNSMRNVKNASIKNKSQNPIFIAKFWTQFFSAVKIFEGKLSLGLRAIPWYLNAITEQKRRLALENCDFIPIFYLITSFSFQVVSFIAVFSSDYCNCVYAIPTTVHLYRFLNLFATKCGVCQSRVVSRVGFFGSGWVSGWTLSNIWA